MDRVEGLADASGRIYARELKKNLKREQDEDRFAPQEAFEDCAARMASINRSASLYKDRFEALACAIHRKEHGDDVEAEIQVLSLSLAPEDVATARGSWWNR